MGEALEITGQTLLDATARESKTILKELPKGFVALIVLKANVEL